MITDAFLENADVNVKVYRKSQEAMNKWNKKIVTENKTHLS